MKYFVCLIASILILSGITGCSAGCSNEVITTILSPSGALKAVVFDRECGATTGFNTQVSVLKANGELSGAGNTLILDGSVPLQIHWLSDSKMSISGIGSAKVFKKETLINGTAVLY